MTIEITQELVDVAEEFAARQYSSKLERDAALLQEIVDLRKKIADMSEFTTWETICNEH